jgi:glycosyltransferase involved in cell wall biosynthesis
MRALIFSIAYLPAKVGGAELAVHELTKRLPGWEFDLIDIKLEPQQQAVEQIGPVRVHCIGGGFWKKYFFPFWAAHKAKQLHREHPFDLVWGLMANQAGIAAAWFHNCFPQVPFLLTLQEGDDLNSWAYRLRLLVPRFFRVFQRATCIQAISQYLATWARQMGARAPITVIPNGVDVELFSHFAQTVQSSREPLIITTSRLVHKNGLDNLIESLTYLPAHIRLQILGNGPDREKLSSLAQKLSLESRVEFISHVDSEKLGEYLSRASVFVRPSRSEGLGNSFLEAMAAGLPVIGTPVGGIPDFLRPGETGWFCEVDNPASIAEQVEVILDPANKDKVNEITARATTMVRERYQWDHLAQQFRAMLESML